MIIDGLRSDSVRTDWMPSLMRIRERSCSFTAHRGVFPSATRVSSASIATGCYPARHGLAGNAIAWDEGDGLKPVSVGPAAFLERWRAVTGHTLLEPTLAEHVADHGGMVIHSNSSPGAAHMQDPNSHALFLHRSGSWSPGFKPTEATLDVTYDGSGDAVTTGRFCEYLLHGPPAALNLLWICEPDHTQHAIELGCPEHRAILAGSDRLAFQVDDTVERMRARGDDVLLLIGSDHGQETADTVVDVDEALVNAGLKASLESSDVVIASSGMGALIYLSESATVSPHDLAAWLERQAWCHQAWHGNELATIGQRPHGGLAVAFAMARRDDVNPFGVRGYAHVVKDPFSTADSTGLGQHGGMGPHEGSPLLIANGAAFPTLECDQASCLVDIAPTALRHLGLHCGGLDGDPLQSRFAVSP
ncbi:MAG: hypothetical protein HOI95_04310 [Chromatiales bacterium]|nr:hypothetical protein [Chromatiales bacterium]